ncbi:hypothetical protein [Streptomyces fuscichromogenes]|uniref:Uncharacterized protein n=1 Tax=Streptomyces fuscichromogenes TaxID=1324013 RepID=A0A917XQW5_9ACTN|nr:hypothetical protein [Streptomyces fuscichromogenes]GGN46952.1 hypothetical protein GCM10011578_100220 [Streptomyces fuscichromogenes]
MELQVGDQLKVDVAGVDATWVKEAVDAVSELLAPDLVRLAGSEAADGSFSETAVAIEFLVASAAGLTVEGLRALIVTQWAALSERRRNTPVAPASEPAALTAPEATPSGAPSAPEVTVSVSAEGTIEVQIRQSR